MPPAHQKWPITTSQDVARLLDYLTPHCQSLGLAGPTIAAASALAGSLLKATKDGEILTALGYFQEKPFLDLVGLGSGHHGSELSQDWDFEICRRPEQGTQIWRRFGGSPQAPPWPLEVGGICLAMAGQKECGDAWEVLTHEGGVSLILVDGLGHGPGAAQAARVALEGFAESAGRAPVECIRALHQSLRTTQGVVAAVASLDPVRGTVTFAGVGNITATLFGPDRKEGFFSTRGVVGFRMEKLHPQQRAWSPSSLLVMHTDGLRPLLNPSPLGAGSAPLTAAHLYHRGRGPSDDCGVVVIRSRTEPT